MSKILTRADAHLAGQLDLPVGEFHRLAFRAGADAIRQRFEESGGVKFPLRLVVDDSPPTEPPDTLPVFLPRGMVEMYTAILVGAAGADGISDYVEGLITWMLSSAIERPGFPEGIVADVERCFEFADDVERERVVNLMLEEVQRWQYVGEKFSRKEAADAA